MKPAEFTDYASAEAFLKAGRKKGERSTADGWNTVLHDRGGQLVLELHGSPIVRYFPSNDKIIEIPMRSHVVADRIQRYGLGERYHLIPAKTGWSISEKWTTLPGVNGPVPIMFPVVADAPANLQFDNTGKMVDPPSPAMPTFLNVSQRHTIFNPLIKRWLTQILKKVDAGWEFTAEDLTMCPMCMEHDRSLLGAWAGDVTHLFSHVAEGVFPPAFVTTLVGRFPHLVALEWHPGGGGKMGPILNRTLVRRLMKNELRRLTY